MPTPIQYPLVNGIRHSFASIEAKLDGQLYIGFKSINYEAALEPGVIKGTHPDPLGDTLGDATYSADFEMWLAEWNLFQAALGNGYMVRRFQITVTYVTAGFDTIVDLINLVRIKKVAAANTQGPEGLSRKVDLYTGKVLLNGIDNLAIPLQGIPQ
jgi:hypothetical protein